jgi:RNA recognition motif-containing protein
MIRNPIVGNNLEQKGWSYRTSQNMSNNKLFVGNLSFDTTENDLQDTFAAHGTVQEVNLMMDRESGRPRGFGFVTMSAPEEAQAAIDALNGKTIDGRALTVNVAKPREERSGGNRRPYSGARSQYSR